MRAALIVLVALPGFAHAKPSRCVAMATAVTDRLTQDDDEEDRDRDRARFLRAYRDSCSADHWSPAAIECFERAKVSAEVIACVVQLTDSQKRGLNARELEATRAVERDPRFAVDCAAMVKHPELWIDVSQVTDAGERTLLTGLVRPTMVQLCQSSWGKQVSACLRHAKDADAEAACIDKARVAEQVDLLMAHLRKQVETAVGKPPDCARVAAAYESNARWRREPQTVSLHGQSGIEWQENVTPNRMRALDAHAQAALIADARKAVRKACEIEKWSPWVRTCIVVGWAIEIQHECLAGIDGTPAAERRWSTPPLELVVTKISECDAYLGAVRGLYACTAADAIEAAIAEAADWAALGAYDAKTCTQRRREIDQLAKSSCRRP
jgi:hypothetical protein